MWLRVGDFYLKVLTAPPEDPEEGGINRYPVFTSGGHDWRVEADTAEVRVWNSLPNPVAIVAYDDAIIQHGTFCMQCCGPKIPTFVDRSPQQQEAQVKLHAYLDAHRKKRFGNARILRSTL